MEQNSYLKINLFFILLNILYLFKVMLKLWNYELMYQYLQ